MYTGAPSEAMMAPQRGLSLKRLSCFAVMLLTGLSALHAQDPDAWDFVPGEKILLYDDYTDMPRGGAPPHWKVRGGHTPGPCREPPSRVREDVAARP